MPNLITDACGTYGGRESCAQGVDGEFRGKETLGETKSYVGG
jgi:hypothetical protein